MIASISPDVLWPIIGCSIASGCLGFFIACIFTSRAIVDAHADGYQEACDDVAQGRIFDGVRWKVAEPENVPANANTEH